MHSESRIQQSKNFRFKRWSRKSYAIFAGINKIISIGTLTAGICEKSLEKAKNAVVAFYSNKEYKNTENEELEADLLLADIQLTAVTVPVTSSKRYYRKEFKLNYIKHPKRLFSI